VTWDAVGAIADLPFISWQGSAWRMHKRKYPAADPGGSLKISGRYNRGLDKFSPDRVWPALYLSTRAEVCLGEVLRHVSSPAQLAALNAYELSELRLELHAMLDCRDVLALGLGPPDLLHDTDYDIPQNLAAAAMDRSAEALLVPSATQLGENIIVLAARLRPDSVVELVSSRNPQLYVPR
jgi:RES domain-containing protein